MKVFIFLLIISLFVLSCSDSKIFYTSGECGENGSEGAAYLRNTSKTKKIQYTVKTIYNNSNDKDLSNSINMIKLNPGEERFLGCRFSRKDSNEAIYKVVGELLLQP